MFYAEESSDALQGGGCYFAVSSTKIFTLKVCKNLQNNNLFKISGIAQSGYVFT